MNRRHGADTAFVLAGDSTDQASRQAIFEQALARWGRVDVLLNNAGYAMPGAVEEVPMESIRRQFEINVFAAIGWMQLAGAAMRRAGQGRIINMSSISGRLTFPGLGVYSASKFALEAVSDAMRLEYQPFGVKVILIEPGAVVTEIWERSRGLAYEMGDWQASPFSKLYRLQMHRAEQLMQGKGPCARIVADAVAHAATSARPRRRYRMPLYSKAGNLLAKLPTSIKDWLILKMVEAAPKE